MSIFDKLLGTIISPSMAIGLLHKQIEDALKLKLSGWVMHYNAIEDEIFFDIVVDGQKRKYPFDEGKKFIDMGKKLLREKLSSDDIIDYVMLDYKVDGTSSAQIFYTTKDNEKHQLKMNI
jgi:hypothetical protein